MTKQDTDTKSKILQAASELFAKFGFDGTSIRDIANAAGVNVAGINYHFSNKQGLYWQIYLSSKKQLSEGARLLSESKPSTETLAVSIFEFLMEHSNMLRNTFKLILSESVPNPDTFQQMPVDEEFGPPGGQYLGQAIERDLGKISPENLFWGVNAIFTYLVHWALMSNTSYCQEFSKRSGGAFSPEALKINIRRQVQATLLFIKQAESKAQKKTQKT